MAQVHAHPVEKDEGLVAGAESDHDFSKGGHPTPKTFTYAEADPNDPPFMRAFPRFQYLEEYLGYWMDNKRFTVLAFLSLTGGVFVLPSFLPLGLLLIIIGAKFRNQAWWDDFIYSKFGKFRTLVLVD